MIIFFLNHIIHKLYTISSANFLVFRSIGSFFTALLITLSLGNYTIQSLKKFKIIQKIRKTGPSRHLSKKKHLQWEEYLLFLQSFFQQFYGVI